MKYFCLLHKRFFYSLFTVCILCSCSSANKADKDDTLEATEIPAIVKKDSTLSRSVILPKINCKADSSVSYALYIPGAYSPEKAFPVIFFFDSHASGALPLEKYKELAEKYGYILAGSNNSKNGMQWEQNRPQIQAFMNDVKERLNADSKRIYTWGFSGGSRVASSVAIFDGGINCVVGMGAGLPSVHDPIKNHFDYLGFAGNEDFNMGEMVALNTSMENAPLRHQVIIFNGKHEWAPAPVAEDAFIWLEMNAMKGELIPKNDSLLKYFTLKSEKEEAGFIRNKQCYDEQILLKKMINYLDGLSDTAPLKAKLESLSASEELKKVLDKKEKLAKEEMALQQSYRNNFTLKTVAWWTSDIKNLTAKTKSSDKETAVMNKRVLAYLSLAAYMNVSSALEAGQLGFAEIFLKIYEMVDPENSEHAYLFADVYARGGNNSKALLCLQKSVKLGFNDVLRMEGDTSLAVLKNTPEYRNLLNEMRSKH